MLVKFTTMHGDRKEIEIDPTTTMLATVYQMVQQHFDGEFESVDHFRLISGGNKPLVGDGKTLAEAGHQEGVTIHIHRKSPASAVKM